jgi:hypothetical protein
MKEVRPRGSPQLRQTPPCLHLNADEIVPVGAQAERRAFHKREFHMHLQRGQHLKIQSAVMLTQSFRNFRRTFAQSRVFTQQTGH